jgi:hypothetical protein
VITAGDGRLAVEDDDLIRPRQRIRSLARRQDQAVAAGYQPGERERSVRLDPRGAKQRARFVGERLENDVAGDDGRVDVIADFAHQLRDWRRTEMERQVGVLIFNQREPRRLGRDDRPGGQVGAYRTTRPPGRIRAISHPVGITAAT